MFRKKISERAVEFILTRQNKELKHLTSQKVAQNIGVNSVLLYLKFIIDLKITLPVYISRQKMHEAFCVLTEDKKKSINELSGELGFATIEDFCVEFETYYAISPDRFKSIRN
jgi:AraC-like DNA-binding protein